MRQEFAFEQYETLGASLQRLTPTAQDYAHGQDFLDLEYSGSGDVTAPLTAVDLNLAGDRGSTSGCEPSDFSGFPAGHIALIQRGTCTFRAKADNAAAAGAAGAIIFNQGNDAGRLDLYSGTLSAPQAAIPVVSTGFSDGAELAALDGVTMRLAVNATVTNTKSFNILADTGGRADRTVVVGAHLDPVQEGPGINDNGSGTAAIRETAIRLGALGVKPGPVRLLGRGGIRPHRLGSLRFPAFCPPDQRPRRQPELRHGCLAELRPLRLRRRRLSARDQGPQRFRRRRTGLSDYFKSQNLPVASAEFDGRSDYFGFIDNGIPAGGLFTGAEDLRTEAEAAIFGGSAGVALDECYHQKCDDTGNLNVGVLEEMSDAIAHTTLAFAMTTSAVDGTDKGRGSGQADLKYKADKLLK